MSKMKKLQKTISNHRIITEVVPTDLLPNDIIYSELKEVYFDRMRKLQKVALKKLIKYIVTGRYKTLWSFKELFSNSITDKVFNKQILYFDLDTSLRKSDCIYNGIDAFMDILNIVNYLTSSEELIVLAKLKHLLRKKPIFIAKAILIKSKYLRVICSKSVDNADKYLFYPSKVTGEEVHGIFVISFAPSNLGNRYLYNVLDINKP